jgi:broad specificity phosphatase PhoE
VKRFCLVRHGQTDWNLEGRYQGQSDVPLNAIGKVEAQTLAKALKGKPFVALYSSDLNRASETAEIIAKVLKLPVALDPRFREINQGDWEGQLVDMIKAHYKNMWRERTTDPADFSPPGGESVAEVARRVLAAMDDIAHLHPTGCILIVSHGLALATIICKEKGKPIGKAYEYIPENAEPTWVEWRG